MSYDIYLSIDTGKDHLTTVVEIGNCTYNLAPMFTKALGHSIRDLHGKVAQDCIESLQRAVADMQNPANKEAYKALNPPNGWGSYETAEAILYSLWQGCLKHHKCIIEVE